MKKVLFFLARFPELGGIEKVTGCIADYLCHTELYDVTIMSIRGNDDVQFAIDKSVRTVRVPSVSENEKKKFVSNFINKEGFEYVIFQDSYEPLEHLLCKDEWNGNVKLIVVEHNDPLCGWKSWKFALRTNFNLMSIVRLPLDFYYRIIHNAFRKRRIYEYCDKYVLLSERFFSGFKLSTGITSPTKLVAINNPVTVNVATDVNLWKKEKVMMFAGRFTKQKGLLMLLDIWKRFSGINQEWSLEIIGDGEEKSLMQDYVTKNSLERVKILPFTNSIEECYRKASLFLMTSVYEGWGLVLTEAMRCGCVPIAFDSFVSVRDIIIDKNTGRLVHPFDIEEYSTALNELVSSKNICQMQRRCIQASERFSLDKTGQEWVRLLN